MRTHSLRVVCGSLFAVVLAFGIGAMPVAGQSRAGSPVSSVSNVDLTGLWDGAPGGPGTRDINQYMKSQKLEIPFTPFGAERYKNVDLAKNPNGYCLPPGPSRALTGPSPFVIVQHPQVVGVLFENHNVYRAIYMDGRPHPEDMKDYPFFMGHSIGKWEAGALVVDTVGINDRTWLDSYGLEHSDKLHLIERFELLNPDLMKYTVTYEDPVFFTKPWTVTLNMERQKDTRLLEYVCMDNEKDLINLRPTPRQ